MPIFVTFASTRSRWPAPISLLDFGRIRWLDAAVLLTEPSPAIVAAEVEMVAHMNQDHADALDLYAHALLNLAGEGWRLTGIDALGCDMRLAGRVARLDFASRVNTPEQVRGELVRLTRLARAA